MKTATPKTEKAFKRFESGACGLNYIRRQMELLEEELNKTKIVDSVGYKSDEIDNLHEYEL